MLTAGNHFPAFRAKSVKANQVFQALTRESQTRWPAVFFLLDFTFVCPAEVVKPGQRGAQ
jgi:alkyl hydroperoxide reductase subunit AhpC